MKIESEREHDDEKTEGKKGKTVSFVDKRRVGRDDPSIEAREPALKPTFVEELEGRVRLAEARLKERISGLEEEAGRSRERVKADLEKRYADRERDLLLDILGILDDLDRAASFVSEAPEIQKGMGIVAASLSAFLLKHGCERVDPLGEPFDPRSMEAIQVLPGPRDTVVSVFAAGFRRGEALLRPARVAVGQG